MGKASRAKKLRKEKKLEVPHFEVRAQLATASSATGLEQEAEEHNYGLD